MFLRVWRFITIILTAMTMALAFCHLMEMPARMTWDAELWMRVTAIGGLYRMFGSVGAFLEVGAVVAVILLSFLVRGRQRAFGWTLAGAACLVVSHLIWWLLVFPANNEFARWTLTSIPADWEKWRAQWEYTHAARAVLQLLGLGALVLSVLIETPTEGAGGRPETPESEPRDAGETRQAILSGGSS
jgi:hypothetical protein